MLKTVAGRRQKARPDPGPRSSVRLTPVPRYKQVLAVDIGWVDGVTRAKRPERVPVVLTRQEVASVLQQMRGRDWVMASLMYTTSEPWKS